MSILKIKIKALEPLVITDGSAESMAHSTLEYIPGNKLLGAMAFKWVSENKNERADDNPEFVNMFLNGAVEWGHAYPLAMGEETIPVPLSYYYLKGYDSLPKAGRKVSDKCSIYNSTRIFDEKLKEKQGSDEGLQGALIEAGKLGKDEPLKVKHVSDTFMSETSLAAFSPKKLFTMHVAIGKNRVAADGKLFGYSSLAKNTEFVSVLIVHDESLSEKLKNLLKEGTEFYVGHSRSAGYGKVTVTEVESCIDNCTSNFKEGINWVYLNSAFTPKHSFEEPIEALERELKAKSGDDSLEIDRFAMFCGYSTLSSFNTMWRLPRRDRKLLNAGSVIRVKSSKAFSIEGSLGGSRNEGYGRILVNPDFLSEFLPAVKGIEGPAKQQEEHIEVSPELISSIRRRAILRIARINAQVLPHDLKEFMDSLKEKRARIPSNQRSNLRTMINTQAPDTWKNTLLYVLDKSKSSGPGYKWSHAVAADPFLSEKTQDIPIGQDNVNPNDRRFMTHRESLSEIFLNLLDKDMFIKRFCQDLPVILGQSMTRDEQAVYENEFHRNGILQIIKEWDRGAKTKGK